MIRVIGTVVMDIISHVNQIPKVGETIIGNDLRFKLGGKGLNQAIFISKNLNQNEEIKKVYFESCIGNDVFGSMVIDLLKTKYLNIDYKFKIVSKKSTGTGIIALNTNNGENSIIVNLSANNFINVMENNLNLMKKEQVKILLGQLEIPIKETLNGFEFHSNLNCLKILNAAPIPSLVSKELIQVLDLTELLIVNEVEKEMLLKLFYLKTVEDIFTHLLSKNAKGIVITLGKDGVLFVNNKKQVKHFPGTLHKAVDTIGAGDCFVGTLTSEILKQGIDHLETCVDYANQTSGHYVSYVKPDYSLEEIFK